LIIKREGKKINIKYSISNWIYGQEPIEKQFHRLSKYKYDAIEIMIEDPSRFELREFKSLMEKYDLPCSSICTMMRGADEKSTRRNLIDKNEFVKEKSIEYLKGCIDIGVKLGAKLVLLVPSGVANVSDGWNEENLKKCIVALEHLGDYAKSLGEIKVVIEPINRYENAFLRRVDQALDILNKLNHPNIKMMIDFFHANIEEDNNGTAIRLAGKKLIHCHIADSNRKSTGRGQTDWFEIFRAIKDINYSGALACEPLPPTGADVYASIKGTRPEADQYAKECIKYLKFIESVID